MRLATTAVLLLLAALPPTPRQDGAPPTPPQQPRSPPGAFGEHPWWDDGKAEVSTYDAEEIVGGEKRRFEATLIVAAGLLDPARMVVEESFDPAFVPMLAFNWRLSIPSGVEGAGPWSEMASLHLRRSDLLVLGAMFSSQDDREMTWARWRRDRPGFEIRSSRKDEGDATHEFEELPNDALFHEQVPLWIRSRRPERARVEKIQLVARRLATGRCPPPTLLPAALEFAGRVDAAPPRLDVRLVTTGAPEVFELAPDFPHTLLKWSRPDGTTWTLKHTTRTTLPPRAH